MINIRKNNGITLISLAITIAIILILTAVVAYNFSVSNEKAYYNKMASDIKLLNDKTLVYYNKYGEIPKTTREITVDGTDYYEIDLSKLEGVTLNYGIEHGKTAVLNQTSDAYVIDDNLNVYYLKGIMLNDVLYHTDSYGVEEAPFIVLSSTETNYEIVPGNTKNIKLTAALKNATGDLTWTTSNINVAQVTGTGNTRTIKLKNAGTAIITVSYGDVSTTFNITVTEKDKSKIWIYNGDGTLTRAGVTVTIGDYVNYIEGTYTHTPDISKGIGTSEPTGSETEGYTLTTSTLTTEDLNWRVLGANEDGDLELISAQRTETLLYLANEEGYIYGEENLNNLCNDLYGQGTNSKGNKVILKGRSYNLEDIDKLANYDPIMYEGYGVEWIYRYPTQEEMDEYTGTENSTRYMQYSTDGGITWIDITDETCQTFRLPGETTTISSANPGSIKVINQYYKYDYRNNITTDDGYTTDIITDIKNMIGIDSLFEFPALATNGVQCTANGTLFGSYIIGIDYTNTFGCCFKSWNKYHYLNNMVVRPVVTISPEYKLIGTGDDIGETTNMWEIDSINAVTPTLILDKVNITAKIGETLSETITATLTNSTGNLTWTSSNTDVAEVVGNGSVATVTYKDEGTTTITVTCGNLSAKCKITVIGCDHTYTTDGICSICGKTCAHTFQDSTCTICGFACTSHTYDSNNTCTICGAIKSCITEGTLITLANGKQVPVEELTGKEKLLVWDMLSGSYKEADIAYIINHNGIKENREIIHLYFSDGRDIEIVKDHGFYNIDLNKTVYINADNYQEYIGDWFVTQKLNSGNQWSRAKLTGVKIEYRETRVYEVVTYGNLTCFTNGLLSISSLLNPFCNIFEVDIATLSYDKKQMAEDIKKYGLFTYEDFKELIPEYAFGLYNVEYLKVALGKELTTWEEINFLADYYNTEIAPIVNDAK